MKKLYSVELFAGCGGMALGLEKAGFHHIALNEFDKNACNTLRLNRPEWKVLEGDIKNIVWKDHLPTNVQIDLLSGGFPCQAFSHSGKRLGLDDTRGTLFYEFARSIKEISPTAFLAENVKGLLTHDNGRTLQTILNTFSQLGYHVFTPLLLNANNYGVAQKRERLVIFGVKENLKNNFNFNVPESLTPINLRDVLFAGDHYDCDVPISKGNSYSEMKKQYFTHIPPGGYWKSLSVELQKKYMGKMFYSEGGRTGVLKRLHYDQPSMTLLTSPSQKQTERCHPIENRPLTIREYARIQSFPDSWNFCGSISSQYKQIGNAVPVNLAYHVGKMIAKQLL